MVRIGLIGSAAQVIPYVDMIFEIEGIGISGFFNPQDIHDAEINRNIKRIR
ncbi:MAG: hypothetical protein HC906_02900, partial [Bacteroidales bacterium]|nr:hypothetical protein [Bacteroidales bacterium]